MIASQVCESAYDRAESAIRRRPSWSSTRGSRRLGESGGGIVRTDQGPGDPRLHGLAHPPGADGDDREARRHGLEDHVAEGLGQAGEGEDVGRRVVVGQVFARSVADEPRERAHPTLDLGPRRAVAHEEVADLRTRLGHDLQRVGQVIDVLLGRDPADMPDHDVVGAEAQPLADRDPPLAVGTEEVAVHAARPERPAARTPDPPARRSSPARGRRSRASGCGTIAGSARSSPWPSRRR